jgi:hypothetical protein
VPRATTSEVGIRSHRLSEHVVDVDEDAVYDERCA